MTRTITLHEWGRVDERLEADDLTAILGHPERPVVVEPSGIPGVWRLRAQAKVGAVRFPTFDLVVRPKAGLRSVFALMGVEVARDWWAPDDEVDLEVDVDLLAGLARLFAAAVRRAIGPGVQHGYVEMRERVVAMRGRLDLATQLRRPATPIPVACRYDDYTPDTPLNRLVKAALARVLAIPGVPLVVRRELLLYLTRLEDVAFVEPDPDWADRWQPTRLDSRYVPAVRLATLILRRLALSEASGDTTSCSFLVDMNDLFERFLEEGLRRHIEDPLQGVYVIGQETSALDVEGRLSVRPDVVVRTKGVPTYVIDAKYILHDGTTPNIDHHEQMLAYAIMHDLRDVALAYVHDGSANNPSTDLITTIRHAGVRIHSWRLDLSGHMEQIERGIEAIAARVRPAAG